MKLLIIRHADPYYEIDSLTEKGWREAELLSERLGKLDIKAFYLSPLGRAKDTAKITLEKAGRENEAVVCDWLREFAPEIRRPDRPERGSVSWDWLPADWTSRNEFYHKDRWMENPIIKTAGVPEEYKYVTGELDKLLAMHGYRHIAERGNLFEVTEANNDTIALFCHFGVECVLLSHIMGVSPFVLWHGMCAAPSSVTTVVTEERRKGIASFRMSSFGDVSHLYAGGEEPAFAARFCECFDNEDERHD